MDLLSKVKNTIHKYGLLTPGDYILVGVSGGPDSVALLDLLVQMREEWNLSLHVAHLNHCFRQEATEEARFVEKLAHSYGLGITARVFDVPAFIRERRLSPQEGAREIRYRFFQEAAQEINATKIAVGHHADDQAETILFNLLRGTGLKGLGGMAPARGKIIRPLIEVTRRDIEDYCQVRGLEARYDSSNYKAVYRRNKIRLQLIPLLEKEFNPHLRAGLVRMGELLRDEDEFIKEAAQKAWDCLVSAAGKKSISLDLEGFRGLPRALQRRLIRHGWAALKESDYSLSWDHVERALALALGAAKGTRLQLPGKVFIIRQGNQLIFRMVTEEGQIPSFCYPLPLPGQVVIEELGLLVNSRILPRDPCQNYEQGHYLDYDLLPRALSLRNRRMGDLWKSRVGTKKLKDLFIDLKIPREKRDNVPLLAAGKEIIWAAEIGPAWPWKVTAGTQRVLQMELQPIGTIEKNYQ